MKYLAFSLFVCLHVAFAQKTLTINEVFWPSRGFAIETDDAFQLSRWGVTETLLKVDYDGTVIPHLATAWEQRSDTAWAFTLRENVTFQNGEPFNASAVVRALEYLLSTETPPRGLDPEAIESITAESDNVVVVTTTVPDVLFPNRLVAPSYGILAPSAYESTPPSPFGTGTGPFILGEVIPEQQATLSKNAQYWNGEVNLDTVTILSTPDADVRATMLQTLEVDVAQQLPIPRLPLLESDPNLTIVREAQPRTVTMYLNHESSPLSDVRVRRAVLHAIDKEAIVTAVLEGVGEVAVGPFSPNEPWFNEALPSETYNPEEAKRLLAEAGYAENELVLRLWAYPARAELPPTTTLLQDMLAQVGIVADVRIAEYNALEPRVLEGDFDIFIVSRGHLLDNYDPEGYLQADFGCGGSFNLNRYCNEDLDAKLAEARSNPDTEARYAIYKDIQTLVSETDVVSIFLNHTVQTFGYREGVLNFRQHPLEYYLLTAELDVE